MIMSFERSIYLWLITFDVLNIYKKSFNNNKDERYAFTMGQGMKVKPTFERMWICKWTAITHNYRTSNDFLQFCHRRLTIVFIKFRLFDSQSSVWIFWLIHDKTNYFVHNLVFMLREHVPLKVLVCLLVFIL